ncbi:MAG TPA: amidohydrolase [Candidatus Babeliales bacterium]|jgi:predicted amidohydrolase YtcJ|nr:amidohydrolase [Candidatus Babeliales bacterium]
MKCKFALCILTIMTALDANAQSKPSATLIVTNAAVYTVDKQHPKAEAVAVIRERIVAVGSHADVDLWRGPKTKVIDAGGKLLLPGFNDAHVHFIQGGAQLEQVQLTDAATPEEFAKRIAAQVKKTSKNEWILGGRWDETKWPKQELPTKALVDPVTGDTPIFVERYDGHEALANSAAMKLAGIDARTQEVPGGVIMRDANGNPTGIFKDAAMPLIFKAIPQMTNEQRLRAARDAMKHAASVGVTSVQHMNPEFADVAAYSELAEKGELTTRIYAAPMETEWRDQAKVGIRRAWGSSYLRLGAVKGYADGSLGSRTAYMFEPFTDDPGNRGLLSDEMHPPSAMRDRLMQADAAGLQLRVHAIGDRAISMMLDIFADIEKEHGYHDQRFAIEHAQHMAEKDFERFAKLHVIASMQPYHAIDDGRWAEGRLGHERTRYSYAWRSFLDHGVALAFGTDWPVAPLDPMLGVYAAVTRATLDGKNPGGWFPEEKITLPEAIEAYTTGAAFAEFQESEKGSITPGKLADMVILSDNIFDLKPETIRNAKVKTTIVGGKVVYEER